MTDKQMDQLNDDLEKLCKKYKITNMAFTGSHPDNHISILGKATLVTLFETALNVGRLWQHVRTVVKEKLNNFDKISR